MNWTLYIVKSARGDYYTGITTDLERRLHQHTAGKGAKYLRGKGPLALMFSADAGDRSLASRLESAVKKLSRTGKQDLIAGNMELKDLLDSPAL